MTAFANYEMIFNAKRRMAPIDESDAAWYHCKNSDAKSASDLKWKDFRESTQGRKLIRGGDPRSYIKPIFGTDNNALEEYTSKNESNIRPEWKRLRTKTGGRYIHKGGYYGLTYPESCHASSILWLKYALTGDAHQLCNVHKSKTEEIYQIIAGLNIDISTHEGGQRTFRQMAERVGLTGVKVRREKRMQSVRRLGMRDRIGMVILIDAHVIGLYKACRGASWSLYCFDNTIGCLHFRNQSCLYSWLDWAIIKNEEEPQIEAIEKGEEPEWKAVVICGLK